MYLKTFLKAIGILVLFRTAITSGYFFSLGTDYASQKQLINAIWYISSFSNSVIFAVILIFITYPQKFFSKFYRKDPLKVNETLSGFRLIKYVLFFSVLVFIVKMLLISFLYFLSFS